MLLFAATMDGLDAMMADLSAKSEPVRRPSKPSPRESTAVAAPATPAGAREQAFGERLRQLHLQIADPSTRAAINHGLGAVCDGWFADGSADGTSGSGGVSSSVSGSGGGGGSYYAKSAALAQYTLASELGRMEYEFTLDYAVYLDSLDINPLRYPENYLLLVQTGDEVLNYHLAEERYADSLQIVQEGGSHRFEGFNNIIPAILEFAESGTLTSKSKAAVSTI